MTVAWELPNTQEYERNKALAEKFRFAFVGCMICQHKSEHPDSAVCRACIDESSEGEKE